MHKGKVMAKHLAIFIGDAIEKILRGEKTIEGRFSISKTLPYLMVKKDDEIYLKQSGGKIIGQVTVDNVLYYQGLDGEAVGKLRKEYNSEMQVEESFWQAKAHCRYASLFFLKNPQRYLTPVKTKKRDRRPWVVLEK